LVRVSELFDLSHTMAKAYLKGFAYPWDALKGIREMIVSLGRMLGSEYQELFPEVWIHSSASIAPTAYLGAPCIIGAGTEVRHGAFVRGAVGALVPLLVTGGIHMDGFMDTSDAMASWQTKERRLEILKDSHVGAFAVIGCAGYLLLSAAVYGEMPVQSAPMLMGVFMISRALSALALAFFKSARPGGMMDGFARTAHRRMVTISAGIYAVLCAFVWAVYGKWIAAGCFAAVAVCFSYYRHMAYKNFGGVTGDLAGWFVQITELALSAVIVVGGKIG